MNDTESCCEVVKLVSVEKHPNADRLEIAKFAFANGTIPDYQVVVGKGDFVVGDLAVYISDDMLVPVDRPEFAFLKDKAKNGYHRVRACRLRGQMSTGLLVKGDNLKLGSDMSNAIGVLKYVNPLETRENSQTGNTNVKRSWFSRFLRKVFPSLLTRWRTSSVPEYSVYSLRKVPDLFSEGEPVIVTEKIHGSNIRFGKINGRIYIGSHRTEKSDSRPWLLRKLFPVRRGKGYYGKDVWTEWFERTFNTRAKLDALPNNVIFYGELFGPGIQPWTYGLKQTQVMCYDAYDLKSKQWLNYHQIVAELPLFIHTVPVYGITTGGTGFNRAVIKNLAEYDTEVKAWYVTDPNHKCNDREGVVIRSVDWKKAGKLVSDRYLASEH